MATMKKSKKTAAICVLASILLITASLLLSTTQAAAETVKYRTVGVFTKFEYIDVGEVEGQPLGIGLYEMKGLNMYENDEIAIYKGWGQFQLTVGPRGFGLTTFEDGSTQWAKYQSPPGTPGEGGEVKFEIVKGTFEYIGGTGRFEGIKGKGSYTGKLFEDHGVIYLDSTAEYTLPPQ